MRKGFCFFLACLIVTALLACSRTEHGAAVSSSDAAPSFSLSSVRHERMSLGDYRGKVVMLEFFASWCPPCRMAAPEIKSLYEKYRGKGLVVLAVAIDEGPTAESAVTGFMREFNLPYPVAIDDGSVSKQYNVISIPTSFIIDKQGKVIDKHIGLSPDFTDTVSKEIEALL